MARKTFTAGRRDDFLEHLRAGMRRGAAAEELGLTRKLVLEYIATHEAYELLVLDAEGEASEHVEEALFQAAVSGNVAACKLWMDLRKPRRAPVASSQDGQGQGEDLDKELTDLMALMEGES